MGAFQEYIKSAVASIVMNKGRTFLTMLGIIIGISSVVAILSIGNGMSGYVNGELGDLSTAGVEIDINAKKTTKMLDIDQVIEMNEEIPNIEGVNVSMSGYGTILSNKGKFNASITGALPAQVEATKVKMAKGRYFNMEDVMSSNAVIVVSEIGAKHLFGNTNVIGMTVTLDVGGKSGEATIIGIRESSQMDILMEQYGGETPTITMDTPFTYLANLTQSRTDTIAAVTVYAEPQYQDRGAAQAKMMMENMLELRGTGAVKIKDYSSSIASMNKIMNIITMVVVLVAAISLIVGGVGVMNIMTVTVTERTREIGIRKSLGARTSYILIQFLAESAIITLTGGLIGAVLGLVISFPVSAMMGFPPMIKGWQVALVVVISTSIGLFFGIYPARKAAKMSPIDALRTE